MPSDTLNIELLELHHREMELIHLLRTRFRFGEINIIMKDGVPFRLKRITEFADILDTSVSLMPNDKNTEKKFDKVK